MGDGPTDAHYDFAAQVCGFDPRDSASSDSSQSSAEPSSMTPVQSDAADPGQGAPSQSSTAPPNMTPAQPYSIDSDQGGSSQATPPADGGFTPAPGAQSIDPDQRGSSQSPPDPPNMTPAQPYSIDPDQGGSSQAPPPADGGFTPAPGAQSIDTDQGGMSTPPQKDTSPPPNQTPDELYAQGFATGKSGAMGICPAHADAAGEAAYDQGYLAGKAAADRAAQPKDMPSIRAMTSEEKEKWDKDREQEEWEAAHPISKAILEQVKEQAGHPDEEGKSEVPEIVVPRAVE